MQDKTDITMTAVLRHRVLRSTLKSFEENLFKDFSNYRLIVNVDPVGDSTKEDVLKVLYNFFSKENVICNFPPKAHFGAAAQWVWDKIESDHVFHLEDDWELVNKVSMDDLINILVKEKNIASIRLLTYKPKYMKGYFKNTSNKYFTINNKLSLNPCLCKGVFLKELSKVMDPLKNPELQVVRATSNSKLGRFVGKWKFVTYDHKQNPIIKNIGKDWRSKRNLIRGKSDFVIWLEADS